MRRLTDDEEARLADLLNRSGSTLFPEPETDDDIPSGLAERVRKIGLDVLRERRAQQERKTKP